MIKGADFLFEAVRNSVEAGASAVHITWKREEDGIVRVRVLDNGSFLPEGDLFEKGMSTHGDGRGMGLFLLKEASPDASIERKGGNTVLSFSMADDTEALVTVLPFIFPLASVTFEYIHGKFNARLDSSSLKQKIDDLETSHAIAEVKRQIRELVIQ